MNYYNYPNIMQYSQPGLFGSSGLFSSLFKNKINWSSLLSGTQKTLNVINQVVPIARQLPPIYKNAKTMFKVMNEFVKVDTPTSTTSQSNTSPTSNNTQTQRQENVNISYDNGPTFFL